MAIQENDIHWVSEPELSFWESTFLPAIAQGLKTTVGHIFDKKTVTQEFPEVKPDLPPNFKGVHRLNRDDEGRVKCVACYMCATACPAHCIYIDAAEAPWEDRDKYPEEFIIDELKCIFCGMCEEACPCDAIELTNEFDISGQTRDEMMYNKEKLLSIFDQTAKSPKDPVRTHRGVLGVASEIVTPMPPGKVPPPLPIVSPPGKHAADHAKNMAETSQGAAPTDPPQSSATTDNNRSH